MKKIAGIATTLAIATAFCGLCTGIAANVTADAESPEASVSTSAVGSAPKVILCAGRSYNNSVTYSIDSAAGDKVTKLTSTDESKYFVENAWFANYSAGEKLPNATTTRTDVTFAGWRYALDGETKVVTTMPTVTDDLYLYAHWTSGDTGSNPTIPDKPDNPDNPGTDPSVSANQMLIKFSDAKVVIEFTVPSWGTSVASVYAWSGGTKHLGDWPGTAISGNTVTIPGTLSSLEGIMISFQENGVDKKTVNFKSELVNGQIIKLSVDGATWSTGDINEFTPVVTKTAF